MAVFLCSSPDFGSFCDILNLADVANSISQSIASDALLKFSVSSSSSLLLRLHVRRMSCILFSVSVLL